MDADKEELINKVIEQIKNDLKTFSTDSKDNYEVFVRNLLMQVDTNILNEYLDY